MWRIDSLLVGNSEAVGNEESSILSNFPGTHATGDMLVELVFNAYILETPVMDYRNDGRYCIDNSIGERSIRPMAIERKNNMAFGSHKGAESSAVYYTFIATCRMRALSFRQLLKDAFTAFMEGRTGFENLTPVILGKSN